MAQGPELRPVRYRTIRRVSLCVRVHSVRLQPVRGHLWVDWRMHVLTTAPLLLTGTLPSLG